MSLNLACDSDKMAQQAAELIAVTAREAVADHGAAHICLSGGTTPLAAYRRLAVADLPWSRVHLWWGDERCLEPDHPQSNYGRAMEALAAAPLIPANLHRIPAELGSGPGAKAYERELRARFRPGPPPWDLVLLGLGADGHTLSLFPGSPALDEKKLWAVGVAPGPHAAPPVARVTLTLAAIKAARLAVFLVSGADKAQALSAARAGEPGLPASRVRPAGGVLWLADLEAAPQAEDC